MTGSDEVTAALAGAADGLARRLRLAAEDRARLAPLLPLLDPATAEVEEVALDGDGPDALGRLHESLLDDEHRRRQGVHYTPAPVAGLLVRLALAAAPGRSAAANPPAVVDPSCGGGVVLLAAADHLLATGWDPTAVLGALHGVDRDPAAAEVTRTALVLWAAGRGAAGDALIAAAEGLVARVVAADALRDPWPGEGHLHAVVGNPPFGGQLARATARDPEAASVARSLLGGSAAGYADTAGLFLVRGVEAVAPGGRVVLIQPLSFLGARDVGAVRRRLEERAVLDSVWLAGERLFGAAVDVCAPVLTAAEPLAVPRPGGPVRVRHGRDGADAAVVARSRLDRAGSWAPVLAAATGVPDVDLGERPTLGDRVRATAGFRDEFYAVAPFVVDLAPDGERGSTDELPDLPPAHARLVTAGLVEPAHLLWGRRTTRLAGRRLQAPAVDVAALRAWAEGPDGDRRLAAWADARLRPKVVVATQTRVVEAAVDDDGTWWPSVPVISVLLDPDHDDAEQRGLVAAALSAPPVTAWAAERAGGTALAPQALKLSARQVMEVPLPVDPDAWAEGARCLRAVAEAADEEARRRHLLAAGRLLTAAHGLTDGEADRVVAWWAARAGCADHL